MRSKKYWQDRAARQMWDYMQSAEETADEVSKLYQKASAYLNSKIDGIFEKYATKHNLTEKEAYDLLNQMTDRTSLRELLQKLENGAKDTEKKELISKLEAPAYRARIERLEQLQGQLDRIMQNVYRQEKALTTSHYMELAQEAYDRSVFDIQQYIGLGFSFAHIDPKLIDKMINSRWSGKNYSSRIWNNTGALAQSLKEELLVGLVTGRTERETAQIITQKFAQGSSRARRLIRTESNYIAGEMDLRGYRECGIETYIYVATLDLKTCDDCAPLDGKEFYVKDAQQGVNMHPMHPWCRCTTMGNLSEKTLQKLTRRARDPKTGKTYLVPASMTYREWYEKYVEGSSETAIAKDSDSGIIKKNGETLKMNLQLFAESDIKKQESGSLKKAIRKYSKQIELHTEKIAHPEKYVSNWGTLDPRMQDGLKRHWNKEISNFNRSIQDRIDELKVRGDYDG